MREDIIKEAVDWLESFSNEERRGLIKTLKKSREIAEASNCPKRVAKARETGCDAWDLKAFVERTTQNGRPRFNLGFASPREQIGDLKGGDFWLTIDEAEEVAARTRIERAAYPYRLKAAFAQLALRQKNKSSLKFRYSLDTPGMTLAYCEEGTPDEETISHEEALAIVRAHPKDPALEPEYGILQTRMFRSRIRKNGELLTIQKTVEKAEGKRPKGRVGIEKILSAQIRECGRETKLIWPVEESRKLQDLLRETQSLCLQKMAENLGEKQAFATVFERESPLGHRLHKTLVASAESKSESTTTCTEHVEKIWEKTEEDISSPRAKLCLSHNECSWLLHLLYSQERASQDWRTEEGARNGWSQD